MLVLVLVLVRRWRRSGGTSFRFGLPALHWQVYLRRRRGWR